MLSDRSYIRKKIMHINDDDPFDQFMLNAFRSGATVYA